MSTLVNDVLIEQSGVIPIREDAEGNVEVLLVTRSCGKGWTVPKGHVEADLSSEQSAAKEALEEAGVLGVVHPEPVGSFGFTKGGRERTVALFAMSVTCELDGWPEMGRRDRRWVPMHEARWMVHRHEMGQIIAELARRLELAIFPRLAAA